MINVFRLTYTAMAVLVVLMPGMALTAVDDSNWRPGPTPDWFVNWDKALAEARKTGRPLFLLNTGSDWCGWCRRLRENVLDKPEFVAFARENLVPVYLDSPSKSPLGNEQKGHNRFVVKSLFVGGGVPHALIVTANGEKLGSIGGGGLALDEYLAKLRGICESKGERIRGVDAQALFSKGYDVISAEIAARRAILPPVTTNDFKAVVTGVAVVDKERRYGNKNGLEFVAPETPLVVPYGKTVLFRVEHDFPEGYGARVWVRDGRCSDGKIRSGSFGSNPSALHKGKGVEYGFLSLLDRGEGCTLTDVKIRTNADPELDDFPHGWTIHKTSVNLTFKAKGDADAVSANGEMKGVRDRLREENQGKSSGEVRLETILPFAQAVRRAKDGDGAGLFSVAIHYARGVEIAPDGALAMKYLEKAVAARHANAALVKALLLEYQFKDSPDAAPDAKKLLDADGFPGNDHVSRRMLYERMGSRYASFRLPHAVAWYCATNESAVAEIRCAYIEAKDLGSPYAVEELGRFKRRVARIRKESEERRLAERAWRAKVDVNARLAQEMLGEAPTENPKYDPQNVSLILSDEKMAERGLLMNRRDQARQNNER